MKRLLKPSLKAEWMRITHHVDHENKYIASNIDIVKYQCRAEEFEYDKYQMEIYSVQSNQSIDS